MQEDENIYCADAAFTGEATAYTDGVFKAVILPVAYSASKDERAITSGSAQVTLGRYQHGLRNYDSEARPVSTYNIDAVAPQVLANDGSRAVVLAENGFEPTSLKYFDPYQNGTIANVTLVRQYSSPTSLAVSPDGQYAYAGNTDGFIHLIDLNPGSDITVMDRQTVTMLPYRNQPTIAVSGDSKHVFWVGRQITTGPSSGWPRQLFRADSLTRIQQSIVLPVLEAPAGFGYAIDASPDGKLVVLVDWETNYMTCYNVADLTEVWSMPWAAGQAVFSLDSERVYAIKVYGAALTVINAATGAIISAVPVRTSQCLAVGKRVFHLYGQGLLIDPFGGELQARNEHETRWGSPGPPLAVKVYYTASVKSTRELRATITGYRNPCLYRKNGLKGALFGLAAQEIAGKDWATFKTPDFGRTWEMVGMIWDDDTFIYTDVCATAQGIEVAAGVKRTTNIGTGGGLIYEVWTRRSSDGVTWDTPSYVGNNGPVPVSIRQKVECGSSMMVIYQGSTRIESKNLFIS